MYMVRKIWSQKLRKTEITVACNKSGKETDNKPGERRKVGKKDPDRDSWNM